MGFAAAKAVFPCVLKGQHIKARRDLRDMSFLCIAIAASIIIVVVIFGYLGSRLSFVNTGYEISEMNRTRSALMEKNRRLRLDIERLKSPERIERLATEELGLGYPTSEQIIRIR